MGNKWIAFLDLLGTTQSTSEPSEYKLRISNFTRIIVAYSEKLGKNSSISYFSDCMYVQSDSISCMVDYLSTIRGVLMSHDIYFSAAVRQGELSATHSPGTGTDTCIIRGASFEGEHIAELYSYQDKFKGIGIRLDKTAVNELQADSKWKHRVVSSFYVPDVSGQCKPFHDIAFVVDALRENERPLVKNLLMDAMHSNSRSPRQGRFYTALIITLMQSYRFMNITWEENTFGVAPALYKIILSFAIDDKKMNNLYGLEHLSLILLDILYNNESLGRENKRQISRVILDSPIIKKKYGLLGNIPKELFSTGNKEKIIKDYQSNLSMEILEKFK